MRQRQTNRCSWFRNAWPIAANGQPDVRALRSQILLMQAEGIADKLAEFIKETQNHVGWTTQLPSTGTQLPIYSIEHAGSTRCGFCSRLLLSPSCRYSTAGKTSLPGRWRW